MNTYTIKAWILLFLQVLATIFYFLSLIVLILIMPFEIIEKVKLLFILFSSACMMAPLLIVTPIGPRCFFAPYVMLIYFLAELTNQFNDIDKKRFANLSHTFIIFTLIGVLYLFYIYGTIAKNNYERVGLAVQASKNGKHTIKVQELPYKNYIWFSDAQAEPWATRFKLFYGIDENISIKMIPHK